VIFKENNSPQTAILSGGIVLIVMSLLGHFWIGLIAAVLSATIGWGILSLLHRRHVRRREQQAQRRAQLLYERAERRAVEERERS
jgi:hypothetical protein